MGKENQPSMCPYPLSMCFDSFSTNHFLELANETFIEKSYDDDSLYFYFRHLSSFFLFSFLRRWTFNHPLFSPTLPPIFLSPSPSEVSLSNLSTSSSLTLSKRTSSTSQSSPRVIRRALSPIRHFLDVPARPSWLDCDRRLGSSPVLSIRLLGFGDASFQEDFWINL